MIVHSRPYQPDGIARQTSGAKIRAVVWSVGRAYIHICRLPLAGARENSGLESCLETGMLEDRKSTRLNSSHGYISYAVFCLKKKKKNANNTSKLDTSFNPSCTPIASD